MFNTALSIYYRHDRTIGTFGFHASATLGMKEFHRGRFKFDFDTFPDREFRTGGYLTDEEVLAGAHQDMGLWSERFNQLYGASNRWKTPAAGSDDADVFGPYADRYVGAVEQIHSLLIFIIQHVRSAEEPDVRGTSLVDN